MKQSLRPWLSKTKSHLVHRLEPVRRRIRGTLTEGELRTTLLRAGVHPGATVMMHVSMNELMRAAPTVDALTLIKLLKDELTADGTLLVLTSPFIGWQADYVATNPSFDVRRTPSRMGLMTELFRRMPDSIRSLHPTHPVAGWGAHAREILRTHHLGETFGESSPFCRMREHDGVVIGIGTDTTNGFTILHAAEYLHPDAREHAFSPDRCVLTIRNGSETIDYAFRPLHRVRDRRTSSVEASLRAANALTFDRYAGLLIASAQTARFIDKTMELISAGSFYRSGPPARR